MLLLVGGSGFLGRHICELAVKKGQQVVIVSRNSNANGSIGSTQYGVHSIGLAEFSGAVGNDILRAATSIIYLASRSIPSSNQDATELEISLNLQPAVSFFQRMARVNRSARLIYFSSGGTIYGSGHTSPISENVPPRPQTPYALGKLQSEMAVKYFSTTYGIKYAILRISNPVGRWQTSNRQGLVGIILNRAKRGLPIDIYGDGKNQRDYFDADDLADLVIRLSQNSGFSSGTWNVGSGLGRGENDVVKLVERVIGRPVAINRLPKRTTDLRYAVVNPSKAESDFGWSAETPLESTIENMWKFLLGEPSE